MIPSRRTVTLAGWSLALFALAGSAAAQQPPQPPRPDKYLAIIRYHIPSPRDQHVAYYREMMVHLKSLGIDISPTLRELEKELNVKIEIKELPASDEEDRGKNILKAYLPGDKALKALLNPSVATMLLVPENFALPEDGSKFVKVRLELASGFTGERAFLLANQVRAVLKQFEFIEAAGYDQRGYGGRPFARLVGWVPVEYLGTLVKDLRTQPSGWFTPRMETEALPAPLSLVNPIRVIEVLPDPEAAPPEKKKGAEEALWFLDKLSPGLRQRLDEGPRPTDYARVEIFLAVAPANDSYRRPLQEAAPNLFIEGRMGPMVTALLPIGQAGKLASLPQVSAIRLAQLAPVQAAPDIKFAGDNAKALEASGLAALHKAGHKGKGVRVAIIDSDFRGWPEQVKAGKLPATTRLIDLTAEFSFYIEPQDYPKDDRVLGHGTHCALAAALAAPQADLTLIRIDPTSLPQLEFVARVIDGEPVLSEHLNALIIDQAAIAKRWAGFRDELAREREYIIGRYEDETDIRREYDFLGPVRGWLFSAREWHLARVAELERGRAALLVLEKRLVKLVEEARSLKGIQIVSTSLNWPSGYPLAGSSPLSRWFDERIDPAKCNEPQQSKALWFVSAGNTAEQTWTGPYRDADVNGVMEFLPPGAKLPAGSWTSDLAFLAWQPLDGKRELDLPEGAAVRVTLQWKEPHDADYFFRASEPDLYLKALADLRLVALRQRDPEAKVLPADDFEVVGRSPLLPQRLDNRPSGATYQQVVEFVAPKAGRYAIQVLRTLPTHWLLADDGRERPVLVELTGLASSGIRPAGVPVLPALETQWDLTPRLFVEVLDSPPAGKGRVVLRDYSTTQGSIGLLADTRVLVSVGAAALAGTPQPYTTRGAPGTLSYVSRPNVLAYDALQLTPEGAGAAYGASVATPFSAGQAAVLLGAGRSRGAVEGLFLQQNGKVVRLPAK
jgi:hypothetical protein